MGKPNPGDAARSNRIIGVVLAVLLAVTMTPAAGIQSAFADEPIARPVTTGGDTTLEGYSAETALSATQREDGMYVFDDLVYAATDGALALVGFDGLPEGGDAVKEITVPETVLVDGTEAPVMAVDIAEGNVAESIVALMLPQSISNVSTATLAAAFPNLAAIEIAAPKASAPVAAGAAALRAAYSSFGGVLYRNAWVAMDGDASQTTLTKELVWAPPATVVARIPAECTSIASGAFADAKDLKTVVCFGVMEDIPQAQKADDGTVVPGAFTDEQIATVNVIVPQTGTVVPDDDRVSADVAVTDVSTMDVKREAWWKAGFASDRITLGEVYGSTTNTLPVTEEGVLETAEAEVAYAPETTQNYSSRKAGIEPPESAIPTPVPDDDQTDPSESGLVFTHLADMTLSVRWKGDPTATPSHLDIPAYATINGVTYPVTEIAPEAFKGAVFLTSITIPETVKTIGEGAFEGCANLTEQELPFALKRTVNATSDEASTLPVSSEESGTDHPTQPDSVMGSNDGSISAFSSTAYGVVVRWGGLYVSTNTTPITIVSGDNIMWKGISVNDAIGEKVADGDGVSVNTTDVKIWHYYLAGNGDMRLWYETASTVGYISFRPPTGMAFFINGFPSRDNGYLRKTANTIEFYANLIPSYKQDGTELALESQLYDSSNGETAFSSTSTVRGAINDLSNDVAEQLKNKLDQTTADGLYAAKNEFESLTERVSALEDGSAGGSGGTTTQPFTPTQNEDGTWNYGTHRFRVVKWGNPGDFPKLILNHGQTPDVGLDEVFSSGADGVIDVNLTHVGIEADRVVLEVHSHHSYDNSIYFIVHFYKDDKEIGSAFSYMASAAGRIYGMSEEGEPIASDGDKKHWIAKDITGKDLTILTAVYAPDGTNELDIKQALEQAGSGLDSSDVYTRSAADNRFAFKADLASLKEDVEALKASGAARANAFFAEAAYDGTVRTSELAVRLADAESTSTVKEIWFTNNNPALVGDGVVFRVKGTSVSRGWGDANKTDGMGSGLALVDVDGGKGVVVEVALPDGVNVPKSMAADSFVAQFARLHYTLG